VVHAGICRNCTSRDFGFQWLQALIERVFTHSYNIYIYKVLLSKHTTDMRPWHDGDDDDVRVKQAAGGWDMGRGEEWKLFERR
jgi:hypothetical protein